MSLKKSVKRGDTLIEVAIALAIFSLITILAIASMNQSAQVMQATLELTMTRNEIDAQAEALRYIQNSYLSERELVKTGSGSELWREYQELWDNLTKVENGLSNNPTKISEFTGATCQEYYDTSNTLSDANHNIFLDKAFVLNTRNLDPTSVASTIISTNSSPQDTFVETSLYPRVIYTSRTASGTSDENLDEVPEGTSIANPPIFDVPARAEGIWVVATRDVTAVTNPSGISNAELDRVKAEFYDFYIRGCWYSPGSSRASTISTVIRLYNPEFIEED